MQPNSSSVVTCKETSSSSCMTICTAKHLQNRSVQADGVGVNQLMCRAVSVADAAVEVGESLLAMDSEKHNDSIAQPLSATPVPPVSAESVPSIPTCTAAAADAQPSDIREPLSNETVAFRNTGIFCHQQPEHTVCLQQWPQRTTGFSCHISESPPAGSTSPGYRLSCDEHSCSENNAEMSGPLDNLAQPDIFIPAEPVVCYTVAC